MSPPSCYFHTFRKYLFESATNETAVTEGSRFYAEIKKAIFSHVSAAERLGCHSLDELLKRRMAMVEEDLARLRHELTALNKQIVATEAECSKSRIAEVDQRIVRRKAEIHALEENPPNVIEAPTDQSAVALQLASKRAELDLLRDQVSEADARRVDFEVRRSAIERAIAVLQGEERHVRDVARRTQAELSACGESIDISGVLGVTVDYTALQHRSAELTSRVREEAAQLNKDSESSLAARRIQLIAEQRALEGQAEATTRAFEAYQKALTAWKVRLADLRGSPVVTPDSLEALAKRHQELTVSKPAALIELHESRRLKAREIFAVLKQFADVHEHIVQNVREYIQRDKLTSDQYRLGFDVRFGEKGLADRFFSVISQNTGVFYGLQEGREKLSSLIATADFATADGAVEFAETLLSLIRRDGNRAESEPTDLIRSLKGGANLEDLYDLLFGFDYLAPVFDLALNGKPLRLLSPGERGILLLVFYLVVDLGDEPLIIDQPEGNLNNQSIVEHLVPVFMTAKARRQIIIVTHNPNIAVVCDAEQIVSCRMQQDDSHRIEYETGALENPIFNELSLDLLEGTAVALDARVATYDAMESRRDFVRLPVVDWDAVTSRSRK